MMSMEKPRMEMGDDLQVYQPRKEKDQKKYIERNRTKRVGGKRVRELKLRKRGD